MENKILRIFKKSVESFDKVYNIKLIGTFGSALKSKSSDFDDIDIITISDKDSHDQFISHVKRGFEKRGFNPIVFQTILEKPKKEKRNDILLHDLNYKSLSDLIQKEWKSVINTMKSEMLVLYGDKRIQNKLPRFNISKEELLFNIKEWSNKIESKRKFEIFEKYLVKIIPKLLKEYGYIDLENLKKIQKIINRKYGWKVKINKIQELLNNK